MAKSPQTPDAGVNPVYMMIGLGIGVALIIAIVIAATEGPTGEVVSSGSETEVVEPSDDATGNLTADEPTDVADESEEPGPAEIDGATALEEAVSDTAQVPIGDGEQAVSEGDGETPTGEEPVQNLSGSAVTPDDTDGLTTPTGEPVEDGAAVAPIPGDSDDGIATDGTGEGDTDLDTSIVVDPDGG